MNLLTVGVGVLVSLMVIAMSATAQETTADDEVSRFSELRQEDPAYTRLFDWAGDPRELYDAFLSGTKKAEADWVHRQSGLKKLSDLGSTKRLEILPLVDWFADEGLAGEAGVAYLVTTDDATILFDVGLNAEAEDPSPLIRNMERLGVNLREIDAIVISHPHGDHTGGGKWAREDTFSLTDRQIDLGKIAVYTPIPMLYPEIEVVHTEEPTIIVPGVATIGVITNYFFFMGETPEQALAVNVEGKGIVVIVGCGHQTLKKIVDRTEALFDAPLYGVLGGLHYPLEQGRNIGIHRYVGTGKLPGEFLTPDEVQENIDYLAARDVSVVGLSPHDSCDTSIELFKGSFPDTYREIVVGREIVIAPPASDPAVAVEEGSDQRGF